MNEESIKEIGGRTMKVVREYIKLYNDLNPGGIKNSKIYQATNVVIVNRTDK